MNNFERYNALHDEVMRRLEDGEITVEQAKAVNDKLFDKYMVESFDYDENIEDEIFEESYKQEQLKVLAEQKRLEMTKEKNKK